MAKIDKTVAVEARAEKIRAALAGRGNVAEKRMFGGICFMVSDHMCCGVTQDDYMFRVGPDQYDAALKKKEARACDFTGRPMTGIVMVSGDHKPTQRALEGWVGRCLAFVDTLPAKKAKPRKKAAARATR